ncbi:MAG: type IX secretion system sortase PorU [Bacteroidota bacterium]
MQNQVTNFSVFRGAIRSLRAKVGVFRESLVACLCVLPLISCAQTVSFQDGTWLKFRVKENGIYHLTYNDLKNAGLNPDNINPSKIHMLAYPTGMLPQANNISRPADNLEVAITITGEADGKFDKDDEIIFYGQGPDRYQYINSKNSFYYENNIYSDVNYYFLRIGDLSGTRIGKSNATGGSHPVIDQYVDFGYYESDLYNDQKSGREWFGEQFETKKEITIRFAMPGIIPNSNVTLVSNLMAQSYEYSYFRMYWNTIQILERKMDTIPQTQYGKKGSYGIDTLSFSTNTVNAPTNSNQDIKITFEQGGGNRSVGYLNYILFTFSRKIAKYDNATFFHIPYNNDILSDISVASFPSDGAVWDVTDPFNVKEMLVAANGDAAKFASTGDSNRSFVVFAKADMKTPDFIENVASQNIHQLSTPTLLIISHPNFIDAANRLAAYRSSNYGIDVKVVTPQQIYNEYSGGRQDISAIRDFIRSLYLKTPGKLQSLLLFGRGSYDYKDRLYSNTNYVPIYESRNSLDPLLTYSSDDYFGFLEDNEGQWREDVADDNTLDIGVGRLPVTDAQQASDLVDKLIAYDTHPDRSLWKQRVLFVADDGDWNIHQMQAEDLAETFEVLYKNYHTSKVYLDAFPQQTLASGQVSPKAKEALQDQLNRGYDIVNYTGHGSERVWMQERILDQETPNQLRNEQKLPLFLTATCEFGRNDDPLLISTAETLLLKKNAGAIGLVTTARPVNTITNSVLNKAFYAAYFAETTGVKDLGSIFKQTKNKSLSGVANRNFSLLGDPSMRFDLPKEAAVITSIQTEDGSDVLKSLSKVTIMGEIHRDNTLSTTFDGTVEVEVFDRRSQLVTLGDENSPFTYKVWDHSLFRGKAKVVDGEFALQFVLPEGVSDNVQNGKVLLHAYSSDKLREAQGTLQNLKVGGTELNPGADVSGPSIELFMGDSTFINGGYANANTHLIGKLYDKSGMNISGYGDGVMTATLDNNQTFIVNDYFIANEDDFTTGWFSFPINNLEKGQHTISFKATDTYGNPGTGSVTFIVSADGVLIVEDLYAYPNPFLKQVRQPLNSSIIERVKISKCRLLFTMV